MSRRRGAPLVPVLGQDWDRSTSITVNRRSVEPGTELSIRGEPGRFVFVEHVRTPKGAAWVTCIGGIAGRAEYRSFDPARIKTVHRVSKRRRVAS